MSTGLNCELVETAPGSWYYLLERGDAPKRCWDWREYANPYGPFPSYAHACRHLHHYHANPGGHEVTRCGEIRRPDEYAKFLEGAEDNVLWMRRSRYRWLDPDDDEFDGEPPTDYESEHYR